MTSTDATREPIPDRFCNRWTDGGYCGRPAVVCENEPTRLTEPRRYRCDEHRWPRLRLDVTEAKRTAWLAQSRWLGADAALAAASWLTLSVDQARSVLDDVDPAVLDDIREPDLSGEYSDDLTPELLAEELGLTRDEVTFCADGPELVEALAIEWEAGRDLVWPYAVQAYALRLLGDVRAALHIERANDSAVTYLRLDSERLEREAGR